MKDKIKVKIEELRDYLKPLEDAVVLTNRERIDYLEEMANILIAEIESLDAENRELQAKVEELDLDKDYYKQNLIREQQDRRKQCDYFGEHIKQLEQDYKDHTEILAVKLNDQIEYLKQDREKIKQLEHKIAELNGSLYASQDYVQELKKQYQDLRGAAEEYLKVDSYGQNVEITDTKRKELQQALAKEKQ